MKLFRKPKKVHIEICYIHQVHIEICNIHRVYFLGALEIYFPVERPK